MTGRLLVFLRAVDRNDLVFWLGLVLFFAGLSSGVSIETALVWTGGVLIVDGMTSSYLTAWLMTRKP